MKDYISLSSAKEWNATTDKFVFCIDCLGISAHEEYADQMVNQLEDIFEAMLLQAGIMSGEQG